jgi:signal peptidase I
VNGILQNSHGGGFFTGRLMASGGALMGLIVFGTCYQPVVVQGRSMQPTLKDGQLVWMNRQHYRWHTVRPDDIVIFRHERYTYIKRVYATAGNTVKVLRSGDGGNCLVDSLGPPAQMKRILQRQPSLGRVENVRIPPRCVFVVGDNANNSLDSRDFGPIPAREIVGYVPDPMAAPPPPPDTRQASLIHSARR